MKELIKQSDLLKAIKYLVIAFLLTFIINVTASAQTAPSFVSEGNNYSASISSKGGRKGVEPTKTSFTWTDKKGNVYPIYITESGSCFTLRTSKTTGKEYRSYLKPDVSEDICRKLGREYKSKRK